MSYKWCNKHYLEQYLVLPHYFEKFPFQAKENLLNSSRAFRRLGIFCLALSVLNATILPSVTFGMSDSEDELPLRIKKSKKDSSEGVGPIPLIKQSKKIDLPDTKLPQKPKKPRQPSSEKTEEWVYILSIDGGGIRGLIPARLLECIEEDLTRKYGQSIRLAQLFDTIAGTSTGGIIGLGLAAPIEEEKGSGVKGYAAKTTVDLYQNQGEIIFPGGGADFWKKLKKIIKPTYSSKPLEKILEDNFQDFRFHDTITRVIIPSYELSANAPYVFDSFHSRSDIQDFTIKDVARATSAAPTYFTAASLQNKRGDTKTFIDGGVTLNNPAEVAYDRTRQEKPHKKYFIVSLGTGESPAPTLAPLEKKGAVKWVAPLTTLMMTAASQFVDQRLQAQKEVGHIDYLRIQPTLHPDSQEMDFTEKSNINKLKSYADSISGVGGAVDRDNNLKYKALISRLEERLLERGITPKGALDASLTLKVLRLGRTQSLELEGDKITNPLLVSLKQSMNEHYEESEPSLEIRTLALRKASLDKNSIPLLIKELVVPYNVEELILDGSLNLRPGIQQLIKLLEHSSKTKTLSLKTLSLRGLGLENGEDTLAPLALLLENVATLKVILGPTPLMDSLQKKEEYKDFISQGRLVFESQEDEGETIADREDKKKEKKEKNINSKEKNRPHRPSKKH